MDYIGKKNFPSVTNRNLLLKFFGGTKEYQKSLAGWLRDMEITEVNDIRDYALE